MFLWLKQIEEGPRTLINIGQIVRIEPSGASGSICLIYLADGQRIYVEHSAVSIAEQLAEVTQTPITAKR